LSARSNLNSACRLPIPVFKLLALTVLLLLAGGAGSLSAQRSGAQPSDEECRNFVQSFYDWYTPNALNDPYYAGEILLKSEFLSPDLTRQLKEVDYVEERSGGDIWLSVDPIVNSEDLWEKFVARNVTHSAGHYLVEVYGVSSEKKPASADVVAELVFQSGQWVFVNFHYPGNLASSGNENLLSVLRRLRRSIYE
jgi:hypothetical protein